jgi:hypothetical protein
VSTVTSDLRVIPVPVPGAEVVAERIGSLHEPAIAVVGL